MPIFVLKLDIWGQILEIAVWIFLILGMMKNLYDPSMPIILDFFKTSRWPTYAGFCAEIGHFSTHITKSSQVNSNSFIILTNGKYIDLKSPPAVYLLQPYLRRGLFSLVKWYS